MLTSLPVCSLFLHAGKRQDPPDVRVEKRDLKMGILYWRGRRNIMKLTRKFCVKMQGGMFVKSLFSYADAYIKNCTWKDLALVKFCLCAIGVMIGLSVPKEKRKIPFLGSLLVFLVTYFPLMGKFIRVIKVERKKQTA